MARIALSVTAQPLPVTSSFPLKTFNPLMKLIVSIMDSLFGLVSFSGHLSFFV